MAWNPAEYVRDENGRWRWKAKPAEQNPVVRELAMNTAFVNRARAWSWAEQARKGGTSEPQDLGKFAPWIASNIEGVAEYWHAVMRLHRAHRPDLMPPDEMISTLGGQAALALDLSAPNPLLLFE